MAEFRNIYENISAKQSQFKNKLNKDEIDLYFTTKHLTEVIFDIKSSLFTEIIDRIK